MSVLSPPMLLDMFLLTGFIVGTYICTYEYTPIALETAAAVIFGERHASGVLPVSIPGAPAARQQRHWYAEVWDKKRDLYSSADLWKDCLGRKWPLDAGTLSALLDRPGYSKHFVVRHPTTQEILGLCATYITILEANKAIGSLALLLVRPTHRCENPVLTIRACASANVLIEILVLGYRYTM